MNLWLKAFLYVVIFSILHFGYELTEWNFLIPFCGINESVFQHLKMAFWAYLITSIVEYGIFRKSIQRKEQFLYTRLLSAINIPWFTLLVWYLIPALFGRLESLPLEVTWALFTTYFSAVAIMLIEKAQNMVLLNKEVKIVILVFTFIAAFIFIWFTYKLPWIDLFIDPDKIK
ncbi:MAG: DUF6512 family protein [Caldanaerobacter sp.]